jgi:CHASE1-domain containing sensor protein/uncharacterized protein YoxC
VATLRSVEGLAALFGAVPAMDRGIFARYVEPLLASDPTLFNLIWAPRVPSAKRAEYEAAVNINGVTDFVFTERDVGKLRPAGQRSEYLPVYMLEPLGANRAALGFDLLSETVRRAGAEQARDSGKAAVSAPFDLVQGGRGLIAYFPVYERGKPVNDEGQRRSALAGFGVGTFRASNLIEVTARDYVRQGLDFWVFDTAATSAQLVHAVMANGSTPPKDMAPDAASLHEGWFFEAPLQIAGRPWKILLRPTTEAIAAERGYGHWILMVLGLIVTAACSIATKFILGQRHIRIADAARAEAERAAAERHALEEREQQRARSEDERKQMLERLALSFEGSVGGVVSVVSDAAQALRGSAEGLAGGAQQVATEANAVAQAAATAAESVETVSAATQQLSGAISEIGQQTRRADEVSQFARQQADGAANTMQGLAGAAQRIGSVVQIIADLRWSPPKSSRLPAKPVKQPTKYRTRLRPFRERSPVPSRRSPRLSARSAMSAESRRQWLRRSTSRMRRRGRSPARSELSPITPARFPQASARFYRWWRRPRLTRSRSCNRQASLPASHGGSTVNPTNSFPSFAGRNPRVELTPRVESARSGAALLRFGA